MLIENDRLLMHAAADAYEVGYPLLQAAIREADSQGIEAYDLTDLLDTRSTGEEFYLDFVHVNHEANEKIARALFEAIFE
jgi:hypothetical protein